MASNRAFQSQLIYHLLRGGNFIDPNPNLPVCEECGYVPVNTNSFKIPGRTGEFCEGCFNQITNPVCNCYDARLECNLSTCACLVSGCHDHDFFEDQEEYSDDDGND